MTVGIMAPIIACQSLEGVSGPFTSGGSVTLAAYSNGHSLNGMKLSSVSRESEFDPPYLILLSNGRFSIIVLIEPVI